MGYLTIEGKLLTYSEYKDQCEQYKIHGLLEFLKIFESHKDQYRALNELHWGEEMEYTLYYFDQAS
jgi:hypothetical protein